MAVKRFRVKALCYSMRSSPANAIDVFRVCVCTFRLSCALREMLQGREGTGGKSVVYRGILNIYIWGQKCLEIVCSSSSSVSNSPVTIGTDDISPFEDVYFNFCSPISRTHRDTTVSYGLYLTEKHFPNLLLPRRLYSIITKTLANFSPHDATVSLTGDSLSRLELALTIATGPPFCIC